MTTEEQRRQWRESKREYRKRTNARSDKIYREKHHESILKLQAQWRTNNKPVIKHNSNRRITFKGERIYLKDEPRKGICSKCDKSIEKGEVERTVLHHLKYDPDNPLENTVELCPSCHRLEHGGGKYSMTRAAINQRNFRARKRSAVSKS